MMIRTEVIGARMLAAKTAPMPTRAKLPMLELSWPSNPTSS